MSPRHVCTIGVAAGVAVGVFVGVGTAVLVGTAVFVAMGDGVAVGTGLAVGVAVGARIAVAGASGPVVPVEYQNVVTVLVCLDRVARKPLNPVPPL